MLDSQINTHVPSPEASPILGATLLLYRLILDIINLHTGRKIQGADDALRLKAEMRQWEAKLLNKDARDGSSSAETSFFTNTLSLYILAASLFLDWVIDLSNFDTLTEPPGLLTGAGQTERNGSPSFNETHRWQVACALSILRQPGARETWSSCYLGTWPMLIFGYAVDTDEDIMLIRRVLSYARHRMGYGENQRILSELEGVWSARGKDARSPGKDAMR